MNVAAAAGEYGADSPAVSALRAALRREKLAAREALDAAARAAAAARIEGHLAALLAPRPPATLAFCWPVRGEFDCRPLALELLAKGWRLCQPVVTATGEAMSFRAWTPESAMTSDPYGIPVPAAGAALRPDIVLVPLVAFDERRYRLGYGGGYFDRTLAALAPAPYAIGIGYEVARAASVHPQAHDVPMDMIVTEAGCRGEPLPVAFPPQEDDHGRSAKPRP